MINTNLVDQIYRILKDKIIKNRMNMGEKINLKEIADGLNVSHTPVREVLNRLVRDSLVVNIPNKGYFVVEIKMQDLIDVLDVRKMIECYSIKSAINNVNPSKFRKMLKDIKILKEEPKNLEKGEIFYHSDIRFHMLIVKGSYNKKLIEMYLEIYNIIKMMILRINYEKSVYEELIDDHINLIGYILDKNYTHTEKLLSIHIDKSKDYYLSILKNNK